MSNLDQDFSIRMDGSVVAPSTIQEDLKIIRAASSTNKGSCTWTGWGD